jgi:hypothetical protein
MTKLIVLISILGLAACAELIQGPRQVDYSENRFYVRHAPTTGEESVDAIADERCRKIDKSAALIRSAQYYWFDLRDADYVCVGG